MLIEYLGYADVFLQKLVAKLSDQTDINKHAINLEPGKKLL